MGMARGEVATRSDDFATIFNVHHRRAVRLAYLLTGDADNAEDIVSDAFAKVYRQWQRKDIDDIGAYIRRAVVNQANSKLRRRYLERAHASTRSGDDRGVLMVDELAGEKDQMWQAIQRLPDKQRRAVVLRYYEDLSVEETAEILGISPGTVKSQVSRGLDRLRQLLGEEVA